jgi:hypothetical protein
VRQYRPSYLRATDDLDAVISEYRCAVGTKLQNSLQLQQGVAIASTDSRFELKFDFDGTIELFRNSTAISISTDGLWQLALWDSRTGKIEIGFFDEAPTVETLDIFKQRRTLFDIAKPAADAAPTAVARCGLSFELDGEPTTIAREGIKTLRILLPRTAGEPLYSSSVEEFSLLAANEQAENFTLKAGQLHPGGLIHLQLSDTRIRAFEGTQTSYSWKFDVSAPILAIYEDTVPLTELHRRLGKLSAELPPLPKGQAPIGTISVGKASAVIVDAVALSFPEDERVTIGLYAERLSDEQRRRIIANRSVWNLDKEVMARAVVSLSTKSKLDSASRLEFTVVRDFLGTFYFDGLRDRLTFSFSDRQLYPSNLRFFHRGTASNVLAMRVRDSQTSTEGQVLFWDLHIEADIN